jgi:hypothetical protein
MLGIRSIIGYNSNILVFLKNLLRDDYEIDSYVKEMKSQLDTKKTFHYCFKDILKNHEQHYLYFIET